MNFNFTDTPEMSTLFPVLPDGEYVASIDSAEWGDSKNSPGNRYLKVTFDVEGMKIFEYLNLINSNEKARLMGMSKTKSILSALGFVKFDFVSDSALANAFEGKLMVVLGNRTEEFNGEAQKRNTIKKFLPYSIKSNIPVNGVSYSSDNVPF